LEACGSRTFLERHLGALAAVVLLAGQVLSQTATAPPSPSADAPANPWAFSLSTYGYIVPHQQSYVNPNFTADHSWLHLEARYNYENQETGSLWAGYNWSVGHKLQLAVTPMIGGVFGRTGGIAPGYETSLTYKKVQLSTQGEYVFDLKDRSGSFFYSWMELTYSPLDWFNVGVAAQRTKAYHTDLDVQRGFLVGFSHKNVNFTTYVFNAGWTDPTVILSLGFNF
jgi:hypothetical protein